MSTNYVTLVAAGGTPVRLADQRGTPYPTTGSGSLVFADAPTIDGATLNAPLMDTITTSSGVLTLPTGTDTLVGKATTDVLTNKSISGATNTLTLIPVTALNGGLNADASHFWRGDGTWSTVGATTLIVGTSVITSGTSGRVLYDNGGVVGEMTNTGTGTVNVLQTSPTLITPALGVATATSLALGGATIGTNGLAVTGTVLFNSAITYGGVTLTNAVTGTGSMVLSASPTHTGTVTLTGGAVAANTPFLVATQTWNNAGVNFRGQRIAITNTASAYPSYPFVIEIGGSDWFTVDQFGGMFANGAVGTAGRVSGYTATAIPAGGTQDTGILLSSTAHFGVLFGSGVPTLSQAQGSLYLRSDGKPYVNTNGTTGWERLAGVDSTNIWAAAQTFSAALTYGGVTLSNAVTGTGNMVLSAGATLTGTTALATATVSTSITGPGTLSNLVMRVQTFTASGTYTPNANMVYCSIQCWGGGGGGGSIASAANSAYITGGGGSGAYSITNSSKATIGASQTVTIGAAGTGATAGANNGGNGGDTSLGTLCVAKGGSGGPTYSVPTYALGGAGGLASGGTGDIKINGNKGSGAGVMPYVTTVIAGLGYGGDSPVLGGGGRTAAKGDGALAGVAGTTNTGGGGSSAWCINGVDAAGGAGGSGYVVVTEYCTA